jgi:hypothetical protein
VSPGHRSADNVLPVSDEVAIVRRYTVKRGDTLGSIADRFYHDRAKYPLIVSANSIADPDRLTVGRRLVIPDVAAAGRAFNGGNGRPAATTAVPDTGKALNQKRLGLLHPLLATRGQAMVDLCGHSGVAVLVTQGLRTWEEQDGLYAKGRTAPPIGDAFIVTKARGGESYHNFGLAFDIVILDAIGKADWDRGHPGWKVAAECGKSVGLEWGGDWKSFKDLPHFQYTGGLTLQTCRELHQQGLSAIWERVK